MRNSCSGCRVLRKGCSEDCVLRPCLEWIKSSESQANATVFLAKFYGRTGLLNLINAGPTQHRPAIFRSLLYEACGRIVNPVHGSVGLLWSNNWDTCQSAVDAVLNGSLLKQSSPVDADESPVDPIDPLKSHDIRHLSKDKKQVKIRPGPVTNLDPSQDTSTAGWEGDEENEIGLELTLAFNPAIGKDGFNA